MRAGSSGLMALWTMGNTALLYCWIAVGSAIGGVARYWCTGIAARIFGETFPWGTLFVNVAGSLIIGFFATLTGPDGRIFAGTTMRQFVMIGLLASPPSPRSACKHSISPVTANGSRPGAISSLPLCCACSPSGSGTCWRFQSTH